MCGLLSSTGLFSAEFTCHLLYFDDMTEVRSSMPVKNQTPWLDMVIADTMPRRRREKEQILDDSAEIQESQVSIYYHTFTKCSLALQSLKLAIFYPIALRADPDVNRGFFHADESSLDGDEDASVNACNRLDGDGSGMAKAFLPDDSRLVLPGRQSEAVHGQARAIRPRMPRVTLSQDSWACRLVKEDAREGPDGEFDHGLRQLAIEVYVGDAASLATYLHSHYSRQDPEKLERCDQSNMAGLVRQMRRCNSNK
ncbi:hypothetical protein OBBRIDRAFT_806207 [Obba rivulosa]|uniref:Uncharacterized protein n=1 Tax=Obba rivulosa TaxID=1052685 RepID=A0A8E2ARV7_9APHY|nr:hypothetical protein OBBRIDRAFT_806207 [Obba rivulosa]